MKDLKTKHPRVYDQFKKWFTGSVYGNSIGIGIDAFEGLPIICKGLVYQTFFEKKYDLWFGYDVEYYARQPKIIMPAPSEKSIYYNWYEDFDIVIEKLVCESFRLAEKLKHKD